MPWTSLFKDFSKDTMDLGAEATTGGGAKMAELIEKTMPLVAEVNARLREHADLIELVGQCDDPVAKLREELAELQRWREQARTVLG